jgi:hypothetical protein
LAASRENGADREILDDESAFTTRDCVRAATRNEFPVTAN